MPTTEQQQSSAVEEYCLERLAEIRRLRQEIDFALRNGVAPDEGRNAETGISIEASADEARPVHRPPTLSPKWKGDIAELKFAYRGMAQNLAIASPLSDSLPWDHVVVTRKGRYLVQVRSTGHFQGTGWVVNLASGGKPAKEGDFDFIAALTPDDDCYIIPFSALRKRTALVLSQRTPRNGATYAPTKQFREAWHLFE
jgi:hypothetical protein